MDYGLARLNMVESQLRPSEVTDRRVLDAMARIPRERFVPAPRRTLAYMDGDLYLSARENAHAPRFLLAPRTLARLIQLAEISDEDVVLDVGCATGYSTAVMAHLAQAVVGLECDPALANEATETLHALDADNVVVVTGPLAAGYPNGGPYDAIVLNGAVPAAPASLLEQLKDGGRLAAIVSAGQGFARVHRFVRSGETFAGTALFEAGAFPLPGVSLGPAFSF